jgi:hypothetical protein
LLMAFYERPNQTFQVVGVAGDADPAHAPSVMKWCDVRQATRSGLIRLTAPFSF